MNDFKGGDCADCSKNPIEAVSRVIMKSDTNENVISEKIYLNNDGNQLDKRPNDAVNCVKTSSQDDTSTTFLNHQRLTNLDFHSGNKLSKGELLRHP